MDDSAEPSLDEILTAARARAYSGQAALEEEESLPMVVVTLDGQPFGLAGGPAKEIVASARITPVPGTPPVIRGVFLLRGEVEAAVDLRSVLGLEPRDLEIESRLVMVEGQALRAGLLVDAVADVTEISGGALRAAVATFDDRLRRLSGGTFSYQGREAIVLDVDRILAEALESGGAT
ncbi:MAG: purine-binding chemotaxis protein CheW [Candidatus Sericytochromatia bacterium]|uniref:Purine-binding chemotaxis protein CheW n=1 Tax=Candidatus Tanganyikabacteria bacterium TaxID=2961651 RepID=A0A937X094_9BACT|nr:purine-binding chemotaxis protein CheW [Candidatus Tanganyikabacteria bacterium]